MQQLALPFLTEADLPKRGRCRPKRVRGNVATGESFAEAYVSAHYDLPGNPSGTCRVCGRPLKDAVSVKLGIGPICRRKSKGEAMGRDDDATVATLPFDPETMDIVWENCPTGKVNFTTGEAVCELRFNISQNPTHHSPTGFEVGYSGSGPSDFALSILNLFVPPGSDGQEPVKCWSGVCSQAAWDLHGEFKREFIATADREGGAIKGDVIRKWIADHPIERQITMDDVLDGDA